MFPWGVNLLRFTHPVLGWVLWAAAAAALFPLLGQPLTRPLDNLGNRLAGRDPWIVVGFAVAAMTLVLAFPERLQFVGDFGLRERAVTEAIAPVELYPGGPGQALPLDLALHHRIPHLIYASGILSPNGAGRLLGAFEAALFMALAILFVRALGLRSAAAVAGVSIVFFGGYLGLFTGFNKSFADICLAAVAIGALGVGVVRSGRGLVPLAIIVALSLFTHRMALGFLPAGAYAWFVWFRHHRRGEPNERVVAATSVALPIVALALMIPRLVRTLVEYDLARNLFREGVGGAGSLAEWLPGQLLDLTNVLLLMSPLAVLGAALLVVSGKNIWQRRETRFLLITALPFLLVTPLLRPEMGVFRLWDFFAVLGVTLSLVTAWLVARGLDANPRATWLAAASVLAVLVPTFQWLALHGDRERGLERIEAFATEPPERTEYERAATWDFLGLAYAKLDRWGDAARAYGASAEAGPSPRVLFAWATSERKVGNLRAAQAIYQRVVLKDPDSLDGWIGLGAVSWELQDIETAGRAATEVLRLDPTNPTARDVLEYIRQSGGSAPDTSSATDRLP
jgi:hypothetical protein